MGSLLDVLFDQPSQHNLQRQFLVDLSAVNLVDVGPQLKGETINPIPNHRMKNIHVFFEWVSSVRSNPVMSTFAVLIAMYISHNIRRSVIDKSRADRAAAYFRDFDARFETYITGKEDIQAKTPTEMVIAEWLYATRLTHRFR